MSEVTDSTVETTPETPLHKRILTKRNLKRGAIAGAVVGGLLYVKSKLNAKGSASVDMHVETADDNTDN